jgi:hypothetical protein
MVVAVSKDIVKQEREALKTFFPSLYREIKGVFECIFPIIQKSLPKEDILFKSKTSGVIVNHFLNSTPQPGSYTLPGVSTRMGDMVVSNIDEVSFLYPIYGFIELNKNPITAKRVKDKIQFKTNYKGNISVYQTLGLHDLLTDDTLRFTITLREIGFWVHHQQQFYSYITSIVGGLSSYLSVLLTKSIKIGSAILVAMFIPIIALVRSREWAADGFVKSLGYGTELAEALDIIGYTVRKDSSLYNKLFDYIRKIFNVINDAIQTILPIFPVPSIKSRKKALTESDVLYENLILDQIKNILLKPCHEIDKIISQHASELFPLAN